MTDIVKKQSFALANILSKFGISIRHSIALEVMAQLNGAKDWNVFSAQDKAQVALSDAQQKLLETVVKTQFETYGPSKDGDTLQLACAGELDGSFVYMARVDPLVSYSLTGAFVRLALEGLTDQSGPDWEVFLVVTLTGKDGQWLVTECVPMSKAELHSQTVTVTLKELNAAHGTVLCPLSGVMHKGGLGIFPFVDGCDMPVFEFLMPERIWNVAQLIAWNAPERPLRYETGTRLTLTVGEIAYCFQEHAEQGSISI